MTSFDSTVCFLLFLSVDFSGQSVKPSRMSTSGQGMTSSSLSSGSRTRVKLSKDTWGSWGSASGLGVTSDCCRVTCSDNENKFKVTICVHFTLCHPNMPLYHTPLMIMSHVQVWMTKCQINHNLILHINTFAIHLSTIYLQRTPDSLGGWGLGWGRRGSPV